MFVFIIHITCNTSSNFLLRLGADLRAGELSKAELLCHTKRYIKVRQLSFEKLTVCYPFLLFCFVLNSRFQCLPQPKLIKQTEDYLDDFYGSDTIIWKTTSSDFPNSIGNNEKKLSVSIQNKSSFIFISISGWLTYFPFFLHIMEVKFEMVQKKFGQKTQWPLHPKLCHWTLFDKLINSEQQS